MKWNEFLTDHRLNADTKYHSPPDGEYLFGKVAHDVLACLTAYKAYLRIATILNNDNIASAMFECLNRWNDVTEEWAIQIASLVKKYVGKYPTESPKWAKLITEIGNIVIETPTFTAEVEALRLPNNDNIRQILEAAIEQSKKLELIWTDIQNQEYKRLWTIIRYGDLV